jgi:hypothetical protein
MNVHCNFLFTNSISVNSNNANIIRLPYLTIKPNTFIATSQLTFSFDVAPFSSTYYGLSIYIKVVSSATPTPATINTISMNVKDTRTPSDDYGTNTIIINDPILTMSYFIPFKVALNHPGTYVATVTVNSDIETILTPESELLVNREGNAN